MARVFVCNGKRAEKPLCFPGSNRKLFSAEEICFYLYLNPAMAEDNLFDRRLPDFFRVELNLKETADKLQRLTETEAPMKELAQALFSSTLFLTEEEFSEYMAELGRLSSQRPWQRQKGKADTYLENHEYRMAFIIYERLLLDQGKVELPESFKGNVIHNLAICELHISGPKSAAVHFAEAYERNHSPESLRSHLFCLRLAKRETEYINALSKYNVPEELRSEIDMEMVECAMEAGETLEYQSLLRIKQLLQEGQIPEYKLATEQLLHDFCNQYRKDAG